MKNDLDVWAVQSDASELETALDNIKTDRDIILYSNLLCNFTLGELEVTSRKFDTILYSEENDLLVMLMRGGKVTIGDMRAYLDKKGLSYSEVAFAEPIGHYKDDGTVPEIWFARDTSVLGDALKDAKEKGVRAVAEYFPLLTGSLELGYLTNIGDFKVKVDGRDFWGLVELEDRLILLINSNKKGPILAQDVVRSLEEEGFQFYVSNNGEFTLPCIGAGNKEKKI